MLCLMVLTEAAHTGKSLAKQSVGLKLWFEPASPLLHACFSRRHAGVAAFLLLAHN